VTENDRLQAGKTFSKDIIKMMMMMMMMMMITAIHWMNLQTT